MARTLMAVCLVAAGALAAQDSPKDFTALHSQLCKKEKWETVAWKTDLHESRAASLKEGKPLFIWAMDGQTLGCT
jgi:hypothetical protein